MIMKIHKRWFDKWEDLDKYIEENFIPKNDVISVQSNTKEGGYYLFYWYVN